MSLYDQVRAFVAEQSGEALEALTPETGLLSDLRMGRKDVDDFLRLYGERFEVDVASFRLSHHFGEERLDPLFAMMQLFFKFWSPGLAAKLHDAAPRDITLYHLATCAERDVWTPPPRHLDDQRANAEQVFDLIQLLISFAVLMIVLFCVFVGATLVGFAVVQWPRFAADPMMLLVGPLFLFFGVGYPLWSFRKTRAWIGRRIADV